MRVKKLPSGGPFMLNAGSTQPLTSGSLIDEHLRVEVQDQAYRSVEHALLLEAFRFPRTFRGVFDKGTALGGFGAKTRHSAQGPLGHRAVVAREDFLLQAFVEPPSSKTCDLKISASQALCVPSWRHTCTRPR